MHACRWHAEIDCVVYSVCQPETMGNVLTGQLRSKGKQVALSLRLSRVQSNQGVSSLQAGVAVPACVGSIEDHGYLMDFGIKARPLMDAASEASFSHACHGTSADSVAEVTCQLLQRASKNCG